jgi:predicted Zn-dependent peptidase
MQEWQDWELPNGIRVVHVFETHSKVAHCGLMVNTGSRDETEAEQGLAHYIEHALFKGTSKRKAYHILSRIDSVGGELNAYTSKEETAIYASFGNEHFGRAVELIADVTFHSTFPEKEIEKEKEVILDEINSYLDSPSEQIFDDFEELVFDGHALGKNILGTEETVRSFTPSDVLNFMKANYCTHEMVFSVVGNIKASQVHYFVNKYLAPISSSKKTKQRVFDVAALPKNVLVKKDTHQAHFMWGARAYPMKHENSATLILVNNLLAGPAMNTRLHLSLREKRGIAYHVESTYQPYTDTGITTIYLGTDQKAIPKCQKVIRAELDLLSNKKMGVKQFSMAKTQLKGHVLLSKESRVNAMLGYAKSILHIDKIETDLEVLNKIDSINQVQIMDVTNEIWCKSATYELVYI